MNFAARNGRALGRGSPYDIPSSHLVSLFLRCVCSRPGGVDANFQRLCQMVYVLCETGDMTSGNRFDLNLRRYLAPTGGGISGVPKFQFGGPQNGDAAIITSWNIRHERFPISFVSSLSPVERCCNN